MKTTWTVYGLDILGNADEGYDLNSWWPIKDVTLTSEELEVDGVIIKKLIDNDILIDSATYFAVEDCAENYIRIVVASTEKPVVDLIQRDTWKYRV